MVAERDGEAKKSGNRTAANLFAGAAALHIAAATISGTGDLVLALTGVAGGPVYAGMNGVVAGLSASAEIAGALAS